MKVDFTSRVASVILAVLFLSNDMMASVQALNNSDRLKDQQALVQASGLMSTETVKEGDDNQVSRQTEEEPSPKAELLAEAPSPAANQTVFADGGHAYLGLHVKDLTNSSEDDVFHFNLEINQQESHYAYLEYETKGLENPEELSKSINGHQVFGSGKLQGASEWKMARVSIRVEELKNGLNSVRFSVAQEFRAPVEVRDVRITLSRENVYKLETQPAVVRYQADAEDFEALVDDTLHSTFAEAKGYRLSSTEVASIPTNISNVTRKAPAYHLTGESEQPYHIAIGVDPSKVPTPEEMKMVEVFYFDDLAGKWLPAEKLRVDGAKLRIEAMVPGETDYFAGMIKAPEMPEASAYIPTSISDVEPANPATGVNIIQPPTVNRKGSANINYPLWIPEGRNGMTPSLAVTYDSDAGTGWMGVGWNIGVSSISVDTRWGVPTYSGTYETEGYLFDGEDLFEEGGFRPNKANLDGSGTPILRNRQTGNRKFFPHVQNAYQTVERHGANPQSYYWVVKDASGTTRYYGSVDGTVMDANSVLRKTTTGNIARWYLAKEVDQWGNTIVYDYIHYSNTSGSNTDMGSDGKGIYLRKITYTGYESTPGAYEIEFVVSMGRTDGTVMMNYGFKVIDDVLLDSVNVKYNSGLLVKYDFGYNNAETAENAHFKTRLTSISEVRDNAVFYKHEMEYYDGALTWASNPGVLEISHGSSYLADIPSYVSHLLYPFLTTATPTPIETSISDGSSGHGSIGVGMNNGFLFITSEKAKTINLGIDGSKVYTNLVRKMEDMNGDGTPDMLVDDGSRVYYQPIIRQDDGVISIGPKIDASLKSFEEHKSTSLGFKLELVGSKPGCASVGVHYASGKSKVGSSLTDYNADGFPDLLYRDGGAVRVRFGEINDKGEYSFRLSSENTFNPVLKGNVVTLSENTEDYRPMEIVRVWEAFADGEVHVTGTAEIMDGLAGEVQVAIQHNNSFVGGGILNVNPSETQSFDEVLQVSKGDKILFRTRSGESGSEDILNWNPSVAYVEAEYIDGQLVDWGNGAAQDAYVLSSVNSASFYGRRKFNVVLNYSNATTLSDDLNVIIDLYVNGSWNATYYQTISNATTSVPTNTLAPFIQGNPSLSGYYQIPGIQGEDLITVKFRLASPSNVKWSDIVWRPTVHLEPDCTDPIQEIHAVPEYESYNQVIHFGGIADLGTIQSGVNHQLLPDIDINASDILAATDGGNGVVYMTVKNSGLVAEKIAIYFTGSTLDLRNNDYNKVSSTTGVEFVGVTSLPFGSYTAAQQATFTQSKVQRYARIEFFAKGPRAAQLLEYVQTHLSGFELRSSSGTLVNTIPAEEVSFFLNKRNDLHKHYKHWGVFGWSPLSGNEDAEIDTAKLKFPAAELYNDDVESIDPGEIDPDVYNASKYEFWGLHAIRGENYRDLWKYQLDNLQSSLERDRYGLPGLQPGLFRTQRGAVSPCILGEMEFEATQAFTDPPGSFSPNYMAYGSLGEGRSRQLSINGSYSSFTGSLSVDEPDYFYSRQLSSFIDINGDGYPDVLTEDSGIKAHITNSLGGHANYVGLSYITVLGKGTSMGYDISWSGQDKDKDDRFKIGNANIGYSWSKTRSATIDINGDGLPDSYDDPSTQENFHLNNGGNFESGTFNLPGSSSDNRTFRSQKYSLSVGALGSLSSFTDCEYECSNSISAGMAINGVGSFGEKFYFDFNGDGLLDYANIDFDGITNPTELWLNTGKTFKKYTAINQIFTPDAMNKSLNIGAAAQGTLTLGPVIGALKFPITGGYSDNYAINRIRTSFIDMNGDGAPDFIDSEGGDLKIHTAKFGKVNKLKKVSNPLGGSFTIDYEVVGNKRGYHDAVVPTHFSQLGKEKMLWDMPMGKWVMASVTIDDGQAGENSNQDDLDGDDLYVTRFAYDGGIKLRRERDFAGFTRVATIQPDFYNILEDYCADSEDFEVENERPAEGLYDPIKYYCPPGASTNVTDRYRYNMTVQDYVKPSELSFGSLNAYEYQKDVLLHDYLLHVHEWEDVLYVAAGPSMPRDIELKWNHKHVELITDVKIDYELRIVATGVVPDESETPIGQVIFSELEGWKLADATFAAGEYPENMTVFPAITDKLVIHYPVVDDRNGVNLSKYRIDYDKFFNVVWFEDFGTLLQADIHAMPVGTVTSGHYETIEQVNLCSEEGTSWELEDISPEQYIVTVQCKNDPTYSNDVIYGIYPPVDNSCAEIVPFGPYVDCAEGGSGSFVSHHTKWIEEVTTVYEMVDASTYDFRIIATMQYFDPTETYLSERTNLLKSHKIYSQNTSTESNLRRYTTVEALDTKKKAPAQIANHLSWSPNPVKKAITDLKYDTYGNVTRITGPENNNSQRVDINFAYDATVHQFVERVDNAAFSEFTCSLYDYGFQQLLQTTDINGQLMRYAYDANRRLQHIWAPREIADPSNGPTVSFEYYLKDATHPVPVAITSHNTGSDANTVNYGTSSTSCDALLSITGWGTTMSSSVRTATFIDGLNRPIQIQTETDFDDPLSPSDHTMVNRTRISGTTEYDRFGNVVRERNDFLESDTYFGACLWTSTPQDVLRTDYDYLNRPVAIESAMTGTGATVSWTTTETSRKWTTLGGTNTFMEESGVPSLSNTKIYLDSKGRKVQMAGQINPPGVSADITTFNYDELGQLVQTTDPAGEVTSYTYDFFGRVIEEDHPDRGVTTTEYDLAGNILKVYTPGTEEVVTGGHLEFDYNYNRLISKTVPSGGLYNVAYTYGQRGDGANGAGRIVEVEQGGSTNPVLTETFKYDELGQVTDQTRVIDVPQVGLKTYTTKFRYDSFGRILELYYPNNEKVHYIYSSLGALVEAEMIYNTCGNLPNLIDTISYDGYGNIVYLQYGNGTKNQFEYHEVTRSLVESAVDATPGGLSFTNVMQRGYTYNSLGLISESQIKPHQGFIGTNSEITTAYQYDGLQRLTTVESAMTSADTGYVGTHYQMETSYLPGGRIGSKISLPEPGAPATTTDIDYELFMTYNNTRKHQLESISEYAAGNSGTVDLSYNTSGSLTKIDRDINGNTSGSIHMFWNEEQWLLADSTANGVDHYVYDYTGERLMKASFSYTIGWRDDNVFTTSGTLGAYKVYVNPYCVALNYDYEGQQTAWITQHYYMGTQRVASGRFARSSTVESRPASGGEGSAVLDQLEGFLQAFGLESGKDYTRSQLDQPVPLEIIHPEYVSQESGSSSSAMTTGEGGLAEYCEGIITEVYWYHPNYLGNVDLVTNIDGEVHQFFLYTPWGENLHEYNAAISGFDSPFRFNAKELDQNTGLHYYGARYYQNKYSMWLSVDPLSAARNWLTPYNFVSNNPIMRIDPTGLSDHGPGDPNNEFPNQWVGPEVEVASPRLIGPFPYVQSEMGPSLPPPGYLIDSESSNAPTLPQGIQGFTPPPQAEMSSYENTWVDNWAQSTNFFAQGSYDITNSFYVFGQAMNPFDYQTTTLTGQIRNGMDNSGYGVTVATSLIPSARMAQEVKLVTGGAKQWLRLGGSYSIEGGYKTFGLRWGASPRYAGKIRNQTLRNFNQSLRNMKLPGNSWRVRDPGHFHFNRSPK